MKALLLMLSPFAPHMCEELWEMAGYGGQVSQQSWPVYDESKTVTATTQMAVQVSGKVKANIVVPTDASDEEIVKAALAEPKIVKLAEDKELVKSVVVKGRLVGQRGEGLQALPGPCLEPGHRAGAHRGRVLQPKA